MRGTIADCLAFLQEKPPLGEYCIVVEGGGSSGGTGADIVWWSELTEQEHVAHYEEQGIARKEAMKQAAKDRGVSKRDIYEALLQEKREEDGK